MAKYLLQCSKLTKHFESKIVLDQIHLNIKKGRIVGLLGPNGSGKTTLLKHFAGLLTPTSGEILINGIPIGIDTKKIVSYLPDRIYLHDWMKVSQLITLFEDFYEDFNRSKAMDMLNRLGIDPNSKLKTMSKGTKEKVQLILVMSRDASLYLLDEPIGGVDPATRDYILDTIISNYNPEASIIISTHLIADIEKILDDVIFIQNGKLLLTQSTDELRAKYGQSIDRYFREEFKC